MREGEKKAIIILGRREVGEGRREEIVVILERTAIMILKSREVGERRR